MKISICMKSKWLTLSTYKTCRWEVGSHLLFGNDRKTVPDSTWIGSQMASFIFVTSRHHCCKTVHLGMKLFVIRKLQLVQNAAACLFSNSVCQECITVVLHTPHWIPFKHRVLFKVFDLLFKVLSDVGPSDLSNRSPLPLP